MEKTYRCVIIPLSEKKYKRNGSEPMTEKKRSNSPKILHSTLMLLGIILILGAVSCRVAESQQTPTPSAEAALETPSAEPTASESAVGTAGEGSDQLAEAEEVDQCLICHADQQALVNTAADLVVVESENSGEG